jgi:hypothetical protein
MSRALVGLVVVSWIAGCTSPKSGPLKVGDAAVEPSPDAGGGRLDVAPPAVPPDAAAPLGLADASEPDTSSPDTAPPDAAPPDLAAPPPDLAPPPPPADAGPCPGVVAPPDFDLACGCNGGGKVRCDGTCSEADDTCTPTGQWYALSNTFLGDKKVLDTYGGARPNQVFMNTPCCAGSNWKLVAAGGGYYRLTNQYLGESRALETQPDGTKLFMGDTGDNLAQLWSIRAAGKGLFRITSKLLGAGRSLDTPNDMKNVPYLGKTGNDSGQLWKLTKLP